MLKNGLTHFEVIQDDCLAALTARFTGKVDLMICNPPYVETPESEEGNADIRLDL
jgi:methylase of polypeptide subunit release factors